MSDVLPLVVEWKEKGNSKLKAEDKLGAVECYSEGLLIGWKAIDEFRGLAEDLEALKVAVAQICANRAHVHLLLDEPELALDDSCKALEVDFQNAKAYWRGATAALRLPTTHARRREAAELLRQGLRLAFDAAGAGTVLPKLLKENLDTFRCWADEGHLPSMFLVALAYLKGNGVAKDNEKALMLFQEAAGKGDSLAKAMAEKLEAQKAEVLPPELQIWAKEAANGDANAQFNLGLAYYRGDMVQQDLFKCEQLWERAAEQGDDMAKENLVTLREHMKLMQNDAKKGVRVLRRTGDGTGGVKQFFLKTGSEVLQGDLKGEGVLSLAQGRTVTLSVRRSSEICTFVNFIQGGSNPKRSRMRQEWLAALLLTWASSLER
ncbi:DAP3-binding cell death enhancer 1 (DAP3-binding cell death enhancer 1 [Durusdinium trenchii]|uniref:Long form (DELE1(L) (Death ligand signal enhancer [Cleaved into: DAP3-binding cell death enhancer 1 short form (DELE1(S) (S-DELE1] n=1 Tax=Durusdinium trenchii TaxID=1381693 RepID=A0ABP0NZQ8_9DINO